jgi:hypothetical protein
MKVTDNLPNNLPMCIACLPRHRLLGFAAFITIVLSNSSAAAQIRVGTNVLVSKAGADREEFEMLAAVDSAHPGRMLACTMTLSMKSNSKSTIVYATFDGGKTWKPTLEDTRTRFVGDPTCAYGRGDTAYAVTLPIFRKPNSSTEMAVYRSVNGGRTWEEPTVIPFIDRQYISVDRTTSSAYQGHVYIHANGERKDSTDKRAGPALQLIRSVDGAKTFLPAVSPPGIERYDAMMPGTGVLRADGALVIPFESTRQGKSYIESTYSEDGGEHLSEPVTIATQTSCGMRGGGLGLTSAIDLTKGPFAGRIYVVWQSKEAGRCQILMASSNDGGKSWSKPMFVNDDRPRANPEDGPNNFMAAVAVNNKGVVGVSWYDRREFSNDTDYSLRFAASHDGGMSFGSSVKVSSASRIHTANERYAIYAYTEGGGHFSARRRGGSIKTLLGPNYASFFFPGDTRDMIADTKGVFHPFWHDSRSGMILMYTAPVTVEGKAEVNGAPELSSYTDITDRVTIEFSRTNYDPATHTVEVAAVVWNTSSAPIRGPLKMRVTSLTSPSGTPRILGSMNRWSGVGAILDLSVGAGNSSIAAGESSRPIPIRIRIDDFKPMHLTTKGGWPFMVTMESRVLSAR